MAKSDNTKCAIAQAFGQLLEETTLDRITVTDIAKKCGINRQTFYYHFHDIYDLLSWTLKRGMEELLKIADHRNWQHCLCALLHGLEDSKSIVNHLVRTTEAATVYILLRDTFVDMICNEIGAMHSDPSFTQEDHKLLAEFYAGGLLEVMLSWIADGMTQTPEQVVDHLEHSLKSDVAKRLLMHS